MPESNYRVYDFVLDQLELLCSKLRIKKNVPIGGETIIKGEIARIFNKSIINIVN